MPRYKTLVFSLAVLLAISAQVVSAQTLSVFSGDGQITVQNFQAEYPLVVLATDSAGRPLAGIPVNWSLSGPGTLTLGSQTVTGSDGQASNRFVGATIYGDSAFTQSTVSANASNSTVTMHVTTSGADLISGSVFVQTQVISPNLGDVLTDTGAAPLVQVNVWGVHQAGVQEVPNVGVRLIPNDPNGPSLACAPGTNLTDANGNANCQVIFSGPIGSGAFSIEVGGYRTFSPFQFNVTKSSSQTVTLVITGGNNQSGAPGAQLPAPLTAKVLDATGKPLPNTPVVWQAVNGTASLTSSSTTSDANGVVSAIVRLGSTSGAAAVQLRTASGVAQVTFNLTVNQTTQPGTGPVGIPAAIQITGGNNQSGPAGAQLPVPLTAKVQDGKGNPLANVAVIWQPINSQAVTLSNVQSTSDANGNVSATAALGSAIGPTQVQLRTASGGVATPFGVAGSTVQTVFDLTVTQAQPGTGQGPAAIRITGGNNQSGPPGARLSSPLTAQVVDATGKPMPNVTVSWQPANPQSVSLSGVVSTSDANGIVTAIATLGSAIGPTTVLLQAGTGGIQTPFGTTGGTAVQASFNLSVIQAQPAGILITGGNNQSGSPGAALPILLTAKVQDAAGNPMPNVVVVWQTVNPQAVSLSNVVSTSDANGIVSAIARLGSVVGPTQVQVLVAGGSIQTAFTLTVNQPQPAGIRILTGNNQSGSPGAQLPVPLTARVEDASGNAVPNVSVIWQPTSPQSVTLGSVAATSDANGVVSAIAILGLTVGPAQVQVRVANTAIQTVFNLQAALTVSGIGIVGGIGQETTAGANFALPITAQVYAGGAAAAGVQVQFVASGAPVSLSNGGMAVTDSNGRATVSAQAGSTPGTAIVTASVGNFSASTSLTIRPAAPGLAPLSFFNSANGQPGAVSPTEIVSIYGAGLAPNLQGCAAANQILGPLPSSLSGATVQFASDGYASSAPLYSVCNLGPGQEYVVVQTPADLPSANITVTVQIAGAPVASNAAPTAPTNPGIFTTVMSDGAKRAVLRRIDGTFVSLENPARGGDRLQAFVTGLGRPVTASGIALQTNQAGITGDDAAPPNPVSVGVADRVLQPVSVIYATDMIGVYVVTFDLPADAPSGNDTAFTVNTLVNGQSTSSDSTKLPIQ